MYKMCIMCLRRRFLILLFHSCCYILRAYNRPITAPKIVWYGMLLTRIIVQFTEFEIKSSNSNFLSCSEIDDLSNELLLNKYLQQILKAFQWHSVIVYYVCCYKSDAYKLILTCNSPRPPL